jgi:hypothetical protein
MSLSYAGSSPAEIIALELSLGARGRATTITPSEVESEHIAALLRRGATSGIGLVMWEIRHPVGTKLDRKALETIATEISEAMSSGIVEMVEADGRTGPEVPWRLAIRR